MIAASSPSLSSRDDPILGVARAERNLVAVFDPSDRSCPELRVTWPICATPPKFPPRFTRDGTPLTSRYSSPFVVFFQANRIGSIFCLAVLLPAFGRFQDVAVGVNCAADISACGSFLRSAPFALPRFNFGFSNRAKIEHSRLTLAGLGSAGPRLENTSLKRCRTDSRTARSVSSKNSCDS